MSGAAPPWANSVKHWVFPEMRRLSVITNFQLSGLAVRAINCYSDHFRLESNYCTLLYCTILQVLALENPKFTQSN